MSVVLAHGPEESLLVADHIVVLQVVLHSPLPHFLSLDYCAAFEVFEPAQQPLLTVLL
jgi:hypothetical protein